MIIGLILFGIVLYKAFTYEKENTSPVIYDVKIDNTQTELNPDFFDPHVEVFSDQIAALQLLIKRTKDVMNEQYAVNTLVNGKVITKYYYKLDPLKRSKMRVQINNYKAKIQALEDKIEKYNTGY